MDRGHARAEHGRLRHERAAVVDREREYGEDERRRDRGPLIAVGVAREAVEEIDRQRREERREQAPPRFGRTERALEQSHRVGKRGELGLDVPRPGSAPVHLRVEEPVAPLMEVPRHRGGVRLPPGVDSQDGSAHLNQPEPEREGENERKGEPGGTHGGGVCHAGRPVSHKARSCRNSLDTCPTRDGNRPIVAWLAW